jgi:ubiquinone/menaquinone biosynthesis C-methylase UbiE
MRLAPIALLAVTFLSGLPASAQRFGKEDLAPYIPTPMAVVERMLEVAHIHSSDVVYDLGSGDGRIVIAAAQKFGAKGVGVEINPDLCKRAELEIHQKGLDGRVTMIHGSALQVDLSPATVVTMFLLTSSNDRLKPNLERFLKPGTRVVSNQFPIRGWKARDVIRISASGMPHTLYLYEIGHTN